MLIQKAEPIIEALERYHADKGVYPPELEALTPDYLDSVPRAGVLVCPEYGYFLPDSERDTRFERDVPVKTYELRLLLHRAEHYVSPYWLYYRPEQAYPVAHEHVGNWAEEWWFSGMMFGIPPWDGWHPDDPIPQSSLDLMR